MTQGAERRENLGGRSGDEVLHMNTTLHIHAVTNLIEDTRLTNNEKDTLRDAGSNSINGPYVWKWQGLGYYANREIRPEVFSPSSDKHLSLLRRTREEYDRLQSRQMRQFLAGEEGLLVVAPEVPISADESITYLAKAQERGVIQGFTNKTPAFPIKNDVIHLIMDTIKHDMMLNREHSSEHLEILFTEPYRALLIVAALHKLGTYIALIDQEGYEGREIGKPMNADYVPFPDQGTEKGWEEEKKYYGGRIPTMEELFELSKGVLAKYAPEDSATLHLLTLPSPLVK